MTYMGRDYYPQWLDNLAEDVTMEAAAMDGFVQGAADVGTVVLAAKSLYEYQDFNYFGPCGDNGFLEGLSPGLHHSGPRRALWRCRRR